MIKKNKKSGGKHIAPKTKYNEVLKFYALTVDNFFENLNEENLFHIINHCFNNELKIL